MRKNKGLLLTSILILFISLAIPGLSLGQMEITSETITGNNASKPIDIKEFYRNRIKILSATKIDDDNATYEVYYKGQTVARLTRGSRGIFKEAFLGNQMAQEIAVQWVDRNRDGVDELLIISTVSDPQILEAFLISPTNGLVPIPSSKFNSLLTPRALPVTPPPDADLGIPPAN